MANEAGAGILCDTYTVMTPPPQVKLQNLGENTILQ